MGDNLTVFALMTLAFAAAAGASGWSVSGAELDSVLSISSAVAAAAFLLTTAERWPAMAAGVFVAQVAVSRQLDADLAHAMSTGVAHTIEPIIGASIATVVAQRLDLTLPRHLLAFFVGPVAVGPLFGALIRSVPRVGEPSLLSALSASWLSHGLGVLVLGALIITFAPKRHERQAEDGLRPAELVFSLSVVGFASLTLFELIDIPVGFLAIVPVAILSVHYGTRAAAACSATLAVVAIGSVLLAESPLPGLSGTTSRVTAQLQIVAIAVVALSVAAEATQRERSNRESSQNLETVQLLRTALTPERIVQGAHVHAEGISTSASARLEVGGDWFHVSETPDGLVHILIGDVTGHGEAAVVPMGQLKFAASAFTTLTNNPAQLLDWLDAYAGNPESRIYATAFCAVYDPVHQRLAYASAGHPPALIGHGGDDWRWLGGARSPLLGLGRRGARRAEFIEVDGPVTLIAYTDGVVERPGEAIDIGFDRLHDVVTRHADEPMPEFISKLQADIGRDDATALRVRLAP